MNSPLPARSCAAGGGGGAGPPPAPFSPFAAAALWGAAAASLGAALAAGAGVASAWAAGQPAWALGGALCAALGADQAFLFAGVAAAELAAAPPGAPARARVRAARAAAAAAVAVLACLWADLTLAAGAPASHLGAGRLGAAVVLAFSAASWAVLAATVPARTARALARGAVLAGGAGAAGVLLGEAALCGAEEPCATKRLLGVAFALVAADLAVWGGVSLPALRAGAALVAAASFAAPRWPLAEAAAPLALAFVMAGAGSALGAAFGGALGGALLGLVPPAGWAALLDAAAAAEALGAAARLRLAQARFSLGLEPPAGPWPLSEESGWGPASFVLAPAAAGRRPARAAAAWVYGEAAAGRRPADAAQWARAAAAFGAADLGHEIVASQAGASHAAHLSVNVDAPPPPAPARRLVCDAAGLAAGAGWEPAPIFGGLTAESFVSGWRPAP